MSDVDVVIVGGGAAGLAAALMLGRARRSVVVVDDGHPRNAPAEHVHGYLGREGVGPAELLAIGRSEVAAYGVEVRPGRAVRVEQRDGGGFAVELVDGAVLHARRVLVATGLRDELPPIPGIAERWGRDVLHCPYCHGWEVRDQRIVVVATSEWGAFQASLWRQWSDDVTLVEARVAGLVVVDDRLEGVLLDDETVVPAAAVVVTPRMIANGELLAPLGIEPVDAPRNMGTMIPADASGATSVPGLYVAGNVSNVGAHVLSAAASGAQAGAAINADLVADDVERARPPVMDRGVLGGSLPGEATGVERSAQPAPRDRRGRPHSWHGARRRCGRGCRRDLARRARLGGHGRRPVERGARPRSSSAPRRWA